MKINKNVWKWATMALGLMAAAGLVLAFPPSEATAGRTKELPPTDVVQVNCVADTDCDGFTDTEEIDGIRFEGVGSFPGSSSSFLPRENRLGDGADLFVIVSPTTTVLSKLPPDPLQTLRAALGVTIFIHQISEAQTGACADGLTGFCVTPTVRAVRIAESQSTGVVLGVCAQATVAIGPSNCIVYTTRIENFVTEQYAMAGDTDTAKRDADILALKLWVIAHEGMHGAANLRRESVSAYGGNHYATSDVVIMSQSVIGKVRGSNITFIIPTVFKPADLDPSTGYQLR